MDYNPIWDSETGYDEDYELDLDQEFDPDESAAYLISYLAGDPYSIADLLRSRDRQIAIKADIAGTEYDSSKIIDFEIDNSLVRGEELEIGTTTPARLTIRLKTNSEIPSNAKITPSFAMMHDDERVTDWFALGSFYVDNRTEINGVWTFECYDKLVFADVAYISSLSYPATMQDVWDEICTWIDFSYGPSVVIDPSYTVPVAPTGYTCRQVMGFIAAANAASVYVGRDELINFKTFAAVDDPVLSFTTADYTRSVLTNPVKTYTRVVVTYDVEDELYYEAGVGDDNHTLYVTIPFATQGVADDLLAALGGITYQPYSMDAKGYPILDPGDTIGFTQVKSMTWQDADISWQDADFPWDGEVARKTYALRSVHTFKGGIRSSFEAPAKSEQQSEFVVEGSLTQQVNRLNRNAVKQGKLYYGVTINPDYGLAVERSDNKGKVILNADEFRFIANGQDALWFDVPNLRWKFTGTLEGADGEFSGKITATEGMIGGWTIEEDRLGGAGIIEGGQINGPTITGALIQTKASGLYPRIELSSIGNLLSAEGSSTEKLQIDFSGGIPLIRFVDFSSNLGTIQQSGGNLNIFSGLNINLNPLLDVVIKGNTLTSLLNAKADKFTGWTGGVNVMDSAGNPITLVFSNGVFLTTI